MSIWTDRGLSVITIGFDDDDGDGDGDGDIVMDVAAGWFNDRISLPRLTRLLAKSGSAPDDPTCDLRAAVHGSPGWSALVGSSAQASAPVWLEFRAPNGTLPGPALGKHS